MDAGNCIKAMAPLGFPDEDEAKSVAFDLSASSGAWLLEDDFLLVRTVALGAVDCEHWAGCCTDCPTLCRDILPISC